MIICAFSPQIQSEDALFGMILFAKAQKIKIATKPLCIYRFHTYSTSEHNLQTNTPLKPYPNYMSDIAYTFCNRYKIKHYHFAYSCTYICLGLLAFIDTFPKNLSEYEKKLRDKLIAFLQVRAIYAFGGICFESDPKYIRDLLKPLEPYMQKISFNTQIAYFYPRLYRVLRLLKSYVKQGVRGVKEKGNKARVKDTPQPKYHFLRSGDNRNFFAIFIFLLKFHYPINQGINGMILA